MRACVLVLARKLIEDGHDPRRSLDFYRGHVLALRAHSIGEVARLSIRWRWSRLPMRVVAGPGIAACRRSKKF